MFEIQYSNWRILDSTRATHLHTKTKRHLKCNMWSLAINKSAFLCQGLDCPMYKKNTFKRNLKFIQSASMNGFNYEIYITLYPLFYWLPNMCKYQLKNLFSFKVKIIIMLTFRVIRYNVVNKNYKIIQYVSNCNQYRCEAEWK